jgi:hypothetical protein
MVEEAEEEEEAITRRGKLNQVRLLVAEGRGSEKESYRGQVYKDGVEDELAP